jgi:hypothetical protein
VFFFSSGKTDACQLDKPERIEFVMYSYQKAEPGQWSVGVFTTNGDWRTESVWNTPEEAAERVHWLNGEQTPKMDDDEPSSPSGQR